MKIITQLSTFDYEEITILGDLERCKLLIDNVPDEKIIDKLYEIRGKGRNDYPIEAVWNSMLIAQLIECSTIAQLRRELSRNRDLRKLCGFNDADFYYGKRKLIPPAKAYTNIEKNLEKIEPMLKDCFNELRAFMYENLNNFGVEVSEDGKIFSSLAKSPCKDEIADGRSEKDADYTFKEIYYKDNAGVTKIKRTRYFGFRIHLLCDANYELPIEYTVTKASIDEDKELIKHINVLSVELRERIKVLMADKGYDSTKLITFLKENGISPVIDIQNHWAKDEKTKQYKETDIVYTYDGKVSIVLDNGKLESLKYLGYDKVRNTLRYGYKDKIYSIDISYDERVFTPIARDSNKWEKLYNKRTASERVNGRLDRDFNLENRKVRGLKKATVLIDIMLIGMLAMAKGHILNKQVDKIRCLKT